MTQKDYFKELTQNAFQNLSKSIGCIETDGKTSIIYYFSALELLFKARLFKEHWSFILQNIDDKKANINNLKDGDFQTVSFDVAASRIRNLFQDLDEGYEKHFEELRKIRNRLIHFDDFNDKDKQLSIENISKTWYYLHYLLNIKWKEVFIDYQNEINEINKKIEQYSGYFWNSKKMALIKKDKNKYAQNPKYEPVKIHNQPFVCNLCKISYDETNNLSLLKTTFDNETYTLIRTCDICDHEDYLFLFSLYLQKNKSINLVEGEFKKFIENAVWCKSKFNTVSLSHYETLAQASLEEIGIDFRDVLSWSYDDYEINCEAIGKNRTEIKLRFYQDFNLEIDEHPAFYVLYTYLIFTLNIDEKEICNLSFEELYNSIDDLRVEFFIDSDGY